MPCALRVGKLSKSFSAGWWQASRPVLSEISFEVPQGQITGFVGLNGAGKTTTLKCIMGFLRPDAGEIEIHSAFGFVSERQSLPDFLSLLQFLQHQWTLSAESQEDLKGFNVAAEAVLRRVGLWEHRHRKLGSFSKGMRQRSAIASALLRNPPLLIMDEPFSGLDVEGRAMVQDLMRELKVEGKSLFFSTHSLLDVIALCDHLIMIRSGKVVFAGPSGDFLGSQIIDLQTHLQQHQLLENRMRAVLEGFAQ